MTIDPKMILNVSECIKGSELLTSLTRLALTVTNKTYFTILKTYSDLLFFNDPVKAEMINLKIAQIKPNITKLALNENKKSMTFIINNFLRTQQLQYKAWFTAKLTF